ncbi:MAG: hypothetical protein N5P05_003849 [Chroococcopsis gigantea SAG 12.99]|jgi:phage I-like protein|nr:hypothetical protein [Chlorogloea purpurea SAG 13.99]MDV3002243.1 hypothetical protein [Chroococcopsis gigantea SAG 12.99]
MQTSVLISKEQPLTTELSNLSAEQEVQSLHEIIEQALNRGYVTRCQQKKLLLALFLNQPFTSQEFRHLSRVCYYMQAGKLRVIG